MLYDTKYALFPFILFLWDLYLLANIEKILFTSLVSIQNRCCDIMHKETNIEVNQRYAELYIKTKNSSTNLFEECHSPT